MAEKVMVMLSGGLDSSVMLMKLKRDGEVAAVFVDRGQKNVESERAAVHRIVRHAKCDLDEIDLKAWWTPADGKVSMIDVPRNAIFALIASPYAMMRNCRKIALGSTTTDAKTGDSNAGFVAAFNRLVEAMGLQKVPPIIAPFLDLGWNKTQLTRWGRENVGDEFIAMTHSCWNREPCGTCPACVAREVALRDSGPAARAR